MNVVMGRMYVRFSKLIAFIMYNDFWVYYHMIGPSWWVNSKNSSSLLLSGIPKSELTVRHSHPTSDPLGISGTAASHQLTRPHQSQQDIRMMGKPFIQYDGEPLATGGLEELGGSSRLSDVHVFPISNH